MVESLEQKLRLISKAWGGQSGWVFFPWITGTAKNKEERAWNEKDCAFFWPRDKDKILAHMASHEHDDLYWTPLPFEGPHRQKDLAMDNACLYADLDESDPELFPTRYKPTIAWESSPGRFQALWLFPRGQILMGGSWRGNENHRLSLFLGADGGGWDITQVLRIPGWRNHKPDHKNNNRGKPVQGRLLWHDPETMYMPDEFSDLPEVPGGDPIDDIVDDEIEAVDHTEVIARVRLKLNKRARELLSAREAMGDRSEQLWYLIRCLADEGLRLAEIVAVARSTVWNKFAGRSDELARLRTEAAKAISQRKEPDHSDEEEGPKPVPQSIEDFVVGLKDPQWLIDGLWEVGACGFGSGDPKSYKSWLTLDMLMSVATGTPFLGVWKVNEPGKVLWVQSEDPGPVVAKRHRQVKLGKLIDRCDDLHVLVGSDFDGTDESWQIYLDEAIEREGYKLVCLDPFMMIAGDADLEKRDVFTRVLAPLKTIAHKHDCAIVIVHHNAKSSEASRLGKRMLGSVALHAWTECALYFYDKSEKDGKVTVERESKSAEHLRFRVKVDITDDRGWTPEVEILAGEGKGLEAKGDEVRAVAWSDRKPKLVIQLEAMGFKRKGKTFTTTTVSQRCDISIGGVRKQLNRAELAGWVESMGVDQWRLRPKREVPEEP